jgi:hypothetical protein
VVEQGVCATRIGKKPEDAAEQANYGRAYVPRQQPAARPTATIPDPAVLNARG